MKIMSHLLTRMKMKKKELVLVCICAQLLYIDLDLQIGTYCKVKNKHVQII